MTKKLKKKFLVFSPHPDDVDFGSVVLGYGQTKPFY